MQALGTCSSAFLIPHTCSRDMNTRIATLLMVLAIHLYACRQPAAQVAPSSGSVQSSQITKTRTRRTSKDDINAIGSRKVCGTSAGNWYSLESEIRIGRGYSRIVDSQVKLLNDPIVTEYVNRVAQNLVRNSDAKVPFTIKVIDSEEVNAFSLPGGFLYVETGLVLAADDEAELAGAMAHEIAHVAARHATRQMTRSNLASLLSIPLIFVGGGAGLALQGVTRIAMPLAFTRFSRSFEAEADYLGLEYMYEAGYDPEALIAFFEKVQAMEHDKPGLLATALASHPRIADRVRKSQAEIAKILPVRQQYVVNTSDFDNTKSRLMAIKDLTKQESGRGPVLLRKVSTKADSDTPADDGEPPVLKHGPQR